MTINHLLQAINDCNNGLVPFNLGNPRSFLYGNKWYPLRAVFNYASGLAGERTDFTVNHALARLLDEFIPYTRIKDVAFNNHTPVNLDDTEKLEEAKNLSDMLNRLLRQVILAGL